MTKCVMRELIQNLRPQMTADLLLLANGEVPQRHQLRDFAKDRDAGCQQLVVTVRFGVDKVDSNTLIN